jgi:hypothetical protein
MDERIIDHWSDDTVLPLINFAMCSFPTTETGGYTPFQLKYGTEDAAYFRVPSDSPHGDAPKLLRRLDANLKTVRALSLEFQEQLILERARRNIPLVTYQPGDLILWNPLSDSSHLHQTKLAPAYHGPFRVIQQISNDIECEHIVTLDLKTFHTSRVKPFIGTNEEAYSVGLIDQDQYPILSVNYYSGNPHIRSSLSFNITFGDFDIRNVSFSQDLVRSGPIKEFCEKHPELRIILVTLSAAKSYIQQLNRTPITFFKDTEELYLSLRYFDGTDRSWYDSLQLPHPEITFYALVKIYSSTKAKTPSIVLFCSLFNSYYRLRGYDMSVHIRNSLDPKTMCLLVEADRVTYPALFA